MSYGLLADLVLLAHLGFVVFVVLGGVLALWWPRVVWIHVPALVWGIVVELAQLTCPLTPLENALREAANEHGYTGDFIDHYAHQLLYPAMQPYVQVALGLALAAINIGVYGLLITRHVARKRPRTGGDGTDDAGARLDDHVP